MADTNSSANQKRAHNFIDLTGQKFGRLTVLNRSENSKDGRTKWLCQCDCGNTAIVSGKYLRSGKTRSCGCLHIEILKKTSTTHGHTVKNEIPVEYDCWKRIKRSCFNRKSKDYPRYGGRGITMYEPWVNDFAAFYDHVGKRPSPKHSIDRIDNNLGYVPGNLRWATPKEQARNKENNRHLSFNGEVLTIGEWGERTGILPQIISSRVKYGWCVTCTLTLPVMTNGHSIKNGFHACTHVVDSAENQ